MAPQFGTSDPNPTPQSPRRFLCLEKSIPGPANHSRWLKMGHENILTSNLPPMHPKAPAHRTTCLPPIENRQSASKLSEEYQPRSKLC